MRKTLLLLGGWLALSYSLLAQVAVPIGTWRTHFSYQNIRHIAITPERVYAAAPHGLFYLSRTDNSLQVLSKNDGLSDVGIAAIAYQPDLEALLLAYRSGTVDLLYNNRVTTFSLIQEAGQETIADIHFDANTAYLATDQGVRVLNVAAAPEPAINIVESYTRLSQTGEPLAIHSITTTTDSIFLATEEGVLGNALNSLVNRQDFNSWRRFGAAEGLPTGNISHVIAWNNTVYATVDTVGLFRYQNGTWALTGPTSPDTFRSLTATADALVMTTGNRVLRYEASGNIAVIEDALINQPQDAQLDESGGLWVGDSQQGLLRQEGGAFQSILPNGPASDDGRTTYYAQQKLLVLSASESSPQFSVFEQGQWRTVPVPAESESLLTATYSNATHQYYFATSGNGILQWDGDNSFSFINISTGGTTLTSNQITALTAQGPTLWVAEAGGVPTLHRFSLTDNQWQRLTTFSTNLRPVQIATDLSNQTWVRLADIANNANAEDQILVQDERADQSLSLRGPVPSSLFPGNEITDLVVDREGQVWISGDEGVAFFPNPFGILSDPTLVKPVFDRQFLLLGQFVTCLTVDGGNRKWMGTRNGLWLFSETGEELVSRFTTQNSPLISDNILDITINEADGEVFILTDQGLVSYRGTATPGAPTHQAVRIFPNPVRGSFDGTVGIQGLAEDAEVKITTISGTLVQSLQAQGGTATWDTRNYAGEPVSTGVYLVFSASPEGEDTFVGKIAVVR